MEIWKDVPGYVGLYQVSNLGNIRSLSKKRGWLQLRCCYKKSLRKLLTIAKEEPQRFDWWVEMERKYGEYVPESKKNNPKAIPPFHFFRGNVSATEILEMSKTFTDVVKDERNTHN